MSGHTVILSTAHQRQKAHALLDRAPPHYVMRLEEPKRTLDQNAKMHAMLTDISLAKPEGRRMTPDDWKCLFMHAAGWESQFLEGFDGRPFPTGFRSSKLSKAQMATLITFIQEYGDRHGVVWSEPEEGNDEKL